jgi:hypothetical protein
MHDLETFPEPEKGRQRGGRGKCEKENTKNRIMLKEKYRYKRVRNTRGKVSNKK